MPRILVVDDQADVRAMIAMVLRVHHFEIVEAESPAGALKAIDDARFDIAIVDIFLQGSNGFDLIGLIRERIPDLPIVAISGITTLDFVSAAPGFADIVCLRKPFRANELVRAIEQAKANGSSRQSCSASS